jgi:hypothetical protein
MDEVEKNYKKSLKWWMERGTRIERWESCYAKVKNKILHKIESASYTPKDDIKIDVYFC